jgi:NDP-sugar pyrophosphorylase family protein
MLVDMSEDPGAGTLPAYRLAIEKFVKDEDFIAMNSDELTNMDLSKMIEKHKKYSPLVTMALSPFPCRFSVVNVKDDKVMGFEYGKKLPAVPVSIGIYVFNRKIIEHMAGTGSMEDVVFHKLAGKGSIIAHMLTDGEEWCTINTVKDVEEAESSLKKWYSDA